MRSATTVSILASMLLLGSPAAYGQEQEPAQASPETQARTSWDAYLSGFALHSRSTYDGKRLRKLNEKAWGGGLGRTWRNENGNESSLYVMAIRDSNRNRQWMAGYAYQWIRPLNVAHLEAGLGLTAVVIRRQDWFHGKPFPAVLPFASFGPERAKLMVTYVPHLPRGKGQGNVLCFQLKFKF